MIIISPRERILKNKIVCSYQMRTEAQREAVWTFRVKSRAENRGWSPGPSSQETSKAPAAQFWGDGESRWDHFQNEDKVHFHASLWSTQFLVAIFF